MRIIPKPNHKMKYEFVAIPDEEVPQVVDPTSSGTHHDLRQRNEQDRQHVACRA